METIGQTDMVKSVNAGDDKPKLGRPRKAPSALLLPITLRLTQQMSTEIDEIAARLAESEGLDKADAQRRLLAMGIKVWKKENPK